MVVIGIVCFVLGVNVGFVLAGLMRAARDEEQTAQNEKNTSQR